jgi:hypothetical protein
MTILEHSAYVAKGGEGLLERLPSLVSFNGVEKFSLKVTAIVPRNSHGHVVEVQARNSDQLVRLSAKRCQ